MTYSVILTSRFQDDVEDFGLYCRDYSDEFADEKLADLDEAITVSIAMNPLSYGNFTHSGMPYRAYLFRAGKRTQYWVVYSVNEQKQTVKLLRFWHAMRDPFSFKI